MYGHDLSGTRWNRTETEIDASSVASLVPSWTQPGLIGVTGTPVVASGLAYFGDWKGRVHAVKASSGQPLWTSPLPGGAVVGSPVIDGALLLVGIGRTLYALDRRSGGVVWQAITNANPYSQINASPVVVGDLVFQGTAQFEEVVGKAPFSFRGSIGAFNVSTGELVWNFYTTPNNATSGAGEGIWSTPGVDTRLGLLYVGTGQNLDSPSGPLADSLLAIHYKTGKLAWSRQFNHPDVFSTADFSGKDADIGASPNLSVAAWTSPRRGREQERHVLCHGPQERSACLGSAPRPRQHVRRCSRLGSRRRRPDHRLVEHRRPGFQCHHEHLGGRRAQCCNGPCGMDSSLRGQRLRAGQRGGGGGLCRD